MVDAAVDQLAAKMCAFGNGQKRGSIVAFSRVKGAGQTIGDFCTAAFCNAFGAGPGLDRQNARQDRGSDTGFGGAIAEPEKGICLKEKLRDRLGRARVDLAFQPVDIGVVVGRFGVSVGIGTDGDLEGAGFGQCFDQFGAVLEAIRVRLERALSLWGIAA